MLVFVHNLQPSDFAEFFFLKFGQKKQVCRVLKDIRVQTSTSRAVYSGLKYVFIGGPFSPQNSKLVCLFVLFKYVVLGKNSLSFIVNDLEII